MPSLIKPQVSSDDHQDSHSSSESFDWSSREHWRALGAECFDHAFMVAAFISTVTIVRRFLIDVQESEGPSMEPTLNRRHDFLAVLTYQPWRFVKVGDIVIAKSPNDPHQKICKRVIGLSGDKVLKRTHGFFGEIEEVVTVPEGYVWLQGDNLGNSYDSRSYGAVPMALITGVAYFRVYPFWQFALLPRTMKYSDQPAYLLQNSSGSSLLPTLSPVPAITSTATPSSPLSHYVSAASLLPLETTPAATEAAHPFESRFSKQEQEKMINEMKERIKEERLFVDHSTPDSPAPIESSSPAAASA